MPDDWDIKLHKFVTEQGRTRSREELRKQIDTVTDYVAKRSQEYATDLLDGNITRAEFEDAMQELLQSVHIIASTVGRGGIARMTADDWLRVANKIEWQRGYLKKFGRKIAADQLSGPASNNRARMYADALHISYYNSVYADQEDRPGDVPRDQSGKELLVELVQNSEEGCEDCAADAALGMIPLDEMGEIGSRSCGDFCKCDLVFSDDE